MYRVEGDGSWQNTKIWKRDVLIEQWNRCSIHIDSGSCVAEVDEDIAPLSMVLLLGVYRLIGAGEFQNTKIFINDEELRGVQSVALKIEKDKDPMLGIRMVFLPNLIEFKDEKEKK